METNYTVDRNLQKVLPASGNLLVLMVFPLDGYHPIQTGLWSISPLDQNLNVNSYHKTQLHPRSLPVSNQRLYSYNNAVNTSILNRLEASKPTQSFPAIIPGYKGKGFLAVIEDQNIPGLHSADNGLMLLEEGNLMQKGLNASGDDNISEHNWTHAAEIVEARAQCCASFTKLVKTAILVSFIRSNIPTKI
ncbi:hypothetical protein L218DRAFT_940302 [Marasmius fiardii PR-910]|nr:hypothetical protein L218DRAFT_940302 [Marasmius fiardii PR-910]